MRRSVIQCSISMLDFMIDFSAMVQGCPMRRVDRDHCASRGCGLPATRSRLVRSIPDEMASRRERFSNRRRADRAARGPSEWGHTVARQPLGAYKKEACRLVVTVGRALFARPASVASQGMLDFMRRSTIQGDTAQGCPMRWGDPDHRASRDRGLPATRGRLVRSIPNKTASRRKRSPNRCQRARTGAVYDGLSRQPARRRGPVLVAS